MAFVNEFVTQGDRDKYFSKYEILEKNYPRDWTIDREREREREKVFYFFVIVRERICILMN